MILSEIEIELRIITPFPKLIIKIFLLYNKKNSAMEFIMI